MKGLALYLSIACLVSFTFLLYSIATKVRKYAYLSRILEDIKLTAIKPHTDTYWFYML